MFSPIDHSSTVKYFWYFSTVVCEANNFYSKNLKTQVEDYLKTWCEEEGCDVPLVEVLDVAVENSLSRLMRSIYYMNNGAFGISYKEDDIKTMHFKDFYIGVQFVRVLKKLLDQFNAITVLTLQNCSLNAEGIEHLATNLNFIQDLNLDDNPIPEQNYDCLLTSNNVLKHLSLKFCQIDATGAERLAKALEFHDPKMQHLLSLNLSSNHIGSDGAKHLAQALRTNRDLTSLSLTDNWIDDEGVSALASVLQEFQLTEEEIKFRQERQLQMLLTKVKFMEELSIPVKGSTSSIKSDQKKGTINSKIISKGRKNQHNSDKVLPNNLVTKIKFALLEAEQDENVITISDSYPLLNSSYCVDKALFCSGNFILGHLSIAYNKVTEDGLHTLLAALNYQNHVLQDEPDLGIFSCNIEGNKVFPDNQYVVAINNLMKKVAGSVEEQSINSLKPSFEKEFSS